jgi:hypothetical protein
VDGYGLDAVACPSLTQCTVVDGGGGQEVTFDPAAPGTPPTTTTLDSAFLSGVTCVSPSQCTAVDYFPGREVTFNPATGAVTSGPATIDPQGAPSAVACGSATQCAAVDYSGREVTFDPTAPGTPVPTALDAGGFLDAVACPSATQCTAVDQVGQQVTFDPDAPGTPAPTALDAGNSLSAVACPSSSQCTAVDSGGQEVTFVPGDPGAPTSTMIVGGNTLTGVACPSASQCTAVNFSSALTFDPTAPGTVTSTPALDPRGGQLTGVACPSTSQCTAVDSSGSEVTFDPTAPGSPPRTPVAVDLLGAAAVACPSTSQCTSVDGRGNEVTFDPTAPGIPNPVSIDGNNTFSAVACPSTSQCVAVDSSGHAVAGDPGDPDGWTVVPIPGANQLYGVACSPVGSCVAVDMVGKGFVGTPVSGTGPVPVNVVAPSISGGAVVGDVLTVTPGSWSNSPTSFSYQWEDCDSAGNACTAITGATGQFYALDGSDAGATIRVREIARNAAGTSAPASSSPTAVVLGAPVNASAPTISGAAMAGQTLSEANGSWSNGPTSFSYQWEDCDSAGNACTAIAGATGQTYTLSGSDAGHAIRVRETATNAAGTSAPATSSPTAVVTASTVNVSPPASSTPTGGAVTMPGSGHGAAGPTAPPKVTGYRITNNPFMVTGAGTPLFATASAARHKRGTTFRYTLSEAATVKITIAQRLPGRHHGQRCLAPSRKLHDAKRCTRILAKGTLTRSSHLGANRVAFSGRIGSTALRPGSYQATLTATGTGQRRSRPQTIRFTIVKP